MNDHHVADLSCGIEVSGLIGWQVDAPMAAGVLIDGAAKASTPARVMESPEVIDEGRSSTSRG